MKERRPFNEKIPGGALDSKRLKLKPLRKPDGSVAYEVLTPGACPFGIARAFRAVRERRLRAKAKIGAGKAAKLRAKMQADLTGRVRRLAQAAT